MTTTSHPKMEKLISVVLEHFKTFKQKDQDTRVMIFSQYRSDNRSNNCSIPHPDPPGSTSFGRIWIHLKIHDLEDKVGLKLSELLSALLHNKGIRYNVMLWGMHLGGGNLRQCIIIVGKF